MTEQAHKALECDVYEADIFLGSHKDPDEELGHYHQELSPKIHENAKF